MAAIVITLVDVVVFLPIAFMQGQVGRNLAEFGVVVVISTLTSLFVSFTITPSLAGNWALRSHVEAVVASSARSSAASIAVRSLVRAPRAAVGLEPPHPVRRVLRGLVRRSRWRWCRSASSATSSSRRSTAARSSSSSPIRSARRSTTTTPVGAQARARDSRRAPTSTPTRPSPGGYAAPFGGFVIARQRRARSTSG